MLHNLLQESSSNINLNETKIMTNAEVEYVNQYIYQDEMTSFTNKLDEKIN